MERLQKILAQAGIASRRQAEVLIQEGKVQVNGQVVTELGTKVDPDSDHILVKGKLIQKEQKRTFIFYKPLYVISSMSDPQKRKVVPDFFRHIKERVYPVGRLDYDTEGLLLVTNDGELANHLLHPRFEVEKQYIATVKGIPDENSLEQLRKGVYLEDGLTAPAEVKMIQKKDEDAKIKLTIHEGRNRQVRRMCKAIGHPVMHLIRTRLANLTIKGLKRGEFRELTSQEVKSLKKLLSGERNRNRQK
ncbi:rRNA pseudouridine synthase [Shimazuella sp. AN120528]|uniref:pseudouridine synthase n=1 Tax=Shimazuella soli TaxID=1892854 RepID=UPI001F0EDD01|nr:rRNA pseudouridine synthase [Shimazuella soli]